jgi:hypothetical protein
MIGRRASSMEMALLQVWSPEEDLRPIFIGPSAQRMGQGSPLSAKGVERPAVQPRRNFRYGATFIQQRVGRVHGSPSSGR